MVFETLLHSDLKEGVRNKQLTGNLFSGDNGGNRITVEITDNGQPATVSGGVTGYVIREDKKTVVITNGTLSGNRASIVLPASAYTVIGQVSIVIKVGTTTVGACTAYVYRSTTDAIVDPGHEVPSVEELLAYIEDCIAATAGANSATLAASSATASANSAASSATQAASSASSAATAANSAATSANTAALAAQSATSAATAATEQVNSAILASESATASANTAALAATSAAEYANEVAESVESEIDRLDDTKAPMIPCEVGESAIAEITDGADGMPMEMTVEIEPMQSGTGDPSPENIRPIIGRTYLRICNTGKNILGGIDFANAIKTAIPNANIDTTTKVVSFAQGNPSDYSVIYRGRTTVAYSYPFKENTRYTIILTGYNSNTSSNSTNLRIYYTDGTYDPVPFGSTDATKTTNAIVTDANKTVNYITKINSKGTGYFYYDECGIFEGVLTVQDFEAFKGAYTTITFPDPPGTVYGGTLTVNKDGSGVLTVDKQYITIDENSTIYQSSSDDYKTQFGVYSSEFGFPYIGSTQYATKCDTYNPPTTFRNQANRLNNDIVAYYGAFSSVSGTKRWVVWRDDRFNTLSDMEAWIASNNIHVIVGLANPVIYTFTASQILSLLGTNNVWANTGNILSVDYSADTKTYIDSANETQDATDTAIKAMIADSDSVVATESHAEGDVFIC